MTVVLKNLVYVHMPKTGGIWVSQVLRALGGHVAPQTSRHVPLSDTPAEILKGRTLLGTIRDPWSWYVSFWRHLQAGQDNRALCEFLGEGDPSFPAVLVGVTSHKWTSVPEEIRTGWPWPPTGNQGLYTALFNWLYGDPVLVDILIDTPQLHEGLSQVLNTPLSPLHFPPTNTGRRWDSPDLDPRSLYGEAEERLVEAADGPLANLLGYRGPFSHLPHPTLRRSQTICLL